MPFISRFKKASLVTALCTSGFYAAQAAEYQGEVTGYDGDMSDVAVVLENREEFRTINPDRLGKFKFNNLAAGDYFIKVQAPDYRTTPARSVTIPVSKEQEAYVLERLTTDDFVFHWEEDQTASGYEYSANVVAPVTVTFLDEEVTVDDSRFAGDLMSGFNVILTNDEAQWTNDHAHRLHQIFTRVGQQEHYSRNRYQETDGQIYSRWTLTKKNLANDIEVVKHRDGSQDIRIAQAAFGNATPKIVEIEGRKGIWYSQRLHQAVTRFVTEDGHDKHQVDRILREQYGVATSANFGRLTATTTGETSSSFQSFKPEERIALINMLEEMPKGFHQIPQLTHIVRRIDGMPHPKYPKAPAVAWPSAGYIEFMDTAFTQASSLAIHRLILHEKAHFIWAHVLDDQTKGDWTELGEWYEDSNSSSGWSTTQTTQFASAYAHLKNPNEDLAESIADFVVNPDILRARAPDKYTFIRDRLMQGNFYISKIREDLTFEVYNLYPDYVYPGKIRRVDVRVQGDAQEDKQLHIEVELHALDLEDAGAENVLLRIVSDSGTHIDMYLYPHDSEGTGLREGLVHRGSARLSQYMKAGYWRVVSARIRDTAGNYRYQRDNTFDMKIYVDNPNEDYFEPKYVEKTTLLSKRHEHMQYWGVDHDVQIINVSWEFDENVGLRDHSPCYVRLVRDQANTASYDEYGQLVEERCSVDFYMPEYMPSSTYKVRYIAMIDKAKNWGTHVFLSDGPERVPSIELVTTNPDTEPPELDVNRISVSSEPTNPDNPNGETRVEITYYLRDNNSGLEDSAITLRDPQGGTHFRWHLVPDRGKLFSRAPPNEWLRLELIWTLPVGSPPGIWGVQNLYTQDKAANEKHYRFDEIIHVDVQNHANTMVIR